MRHATLRQLQIFETVARHSSFTRAAEELGLSQPTVSMQIKKLADEVGTPLFDIKGKSTQLTEVGKALQSTCRETFAALERFEMAVANLHGLRTGLLRLAIVNTAKYFIPLLLGIFCKRYPDIQVRLEIVNRDTILTRLAAEEDDIYIMSQPPTELTVDCIPFLENPLLMIAPLDHPLTQQPRIALEALVQEPFLLRENTSGTRYALEHFLSYHGIKPNIRMVLNNNEAIKQAVLGGLGIAALSGHALRNELNTGQLTLLNVPGFPLRGQWYVVLPEGKSLSVVAQAFLNFLRDEARELLAEKTPFNKCSPGVNQPRIKN